MVLVISLASRSRMRAAFGFSSCSPRRARRLPSLSVPVSTSTSMSAVNAENPSKSSQALMRCKRSFIDSPLCEI